MVRRKTKGTNSPAMNRNSIVQSLDSDKSIFVFNEGRLRKKTELVRNQEILIPGKIF
jgi:hypothetical protein